MRAIAGPTSRDLLADAMQRVQQEGWHVGNLDCTVFAEQPRIAPYSEAIRRSIADLVGADPARISVKGKTSERLGFIGRGRSDRGQRGRVVVRFMSAARVS